MLGTTLPRPLPLRPAAMELPTCPAAAGPALGDPGWTFDDDADDTHFPAMRHWAAAGVRGGIPPRAAIPVRERLAPAAVAPAGGVIDDDGPRIQAAVDAASLLGGGVVWLAAGAYRLASALALRSGVVLRGDGAGATTVEISMRFRGDSAADKTPAVSLVGVSRSGLEDLTLVYVVTHRGRRVRPLDTDWATDYFSKYETRGQAFKNERLYYDRPGFAYVAATDLYVDSVWVKDAIDCWVDGCAVLDAGSNGVIIGRDSRHITLRGNTVRGSFQKGPNGNGYGINCAGRSVLAVRNSVSHVRHWAVQCGAARCVIVDNTIGVDLNFHQRDDGDNLIERNRIHIPTWHLWRAFQRGAAFHGDPGKGNLFFRNDVVQRRDGRLYEDAGTVWTMGTAEPAPVDGGHCPRKGALYAVKRG